MNGITIKHIEALEDAMKYMADQEGKSHQGYFSSGWVGAKLRELQSILRTELENPTDDKQIQERLL